jgi:hypothetical protein
MAVARIKGVNLVYALKAFFRDDARLRREGNLLFNNSISV